MNSADFKKKLANFSTQFGLDDKEYYSHIGKKNFSTFWNSCTDTLIMFWLLDCLGFDFWQISEDYNSAIKSAEKRYIIKTKKIFNKFIIGAKRIESESPYVYGSPDHIKYYIKNIKPLNDKYDKSLKPFRKEREEKIKMIQSKYCEIIRIYFPATIVEKALSKI